MSRMLRKLRPGPGSSKGKKGARHSHRNEDDVLFDISREELSKLLGRADRKNGGVVGSSDAKHHGLVILCIFSRVLSP